MQLCASCGSQTPTDPCIECDSDPRLDGRYVLEALLGQGSHGMTWRARGPDDRLVAIKVINLGHGLSEQGQRALEREVSVLRQLSHRQIPDYIEDFSTRSGMSRYRCIVQEHIDGSSLQDRLQTTRHTPAGVMRILAEVADILTYLHGLSPPIIHRDIKPSNILRRADGSLVLIDFGSVRDTVLGTLGGTLSVGTIGYMAPEQIRGDAQPASDLYALGALAVHLLTRAPPQVMSHNPDDPLRWHRPAGLAPAIGDFVDTLLHPDPQHRPPSAAAVRDRAAALARGEGAVALPVRRFDDEVVVRTWRQRRQLPGMYPLMGAGLILCTVIAAIDVESIVVSGPIAAAVGLLVTVLSGARGNRAGVLAGLTVPAFALVTFLVIAVGNLSPGDAQVPVPLAMLLFTGLLLPLLARARRHSQAAVTASSTPISLAATPQVSPQLTASPGEARDRGWHPTRTLERHRARRERSTRRRAPDTDPSWGHPGSSPSTGHARDRRSTEEERSEMKALARRWRESQPGRLHSCPLCHAMVYPNKLVHHYDKAHNPRSWKRTRKREQDR